MRVLILAFSILAILIGAEAKAGPSTTDRDDASASVDQAATDQAATANTDQAATGNEATQQEATEETEDRIGLDKRKRRDVQRRLTRLGFDIKANGRFDTPTRAVIERWQAARDYPKTGYLNTLQYQALVTESVSTANASVGERSEHRRRRHHGSPGGPVGVIGGVVGGVVGGIFGRR